MYLICFDLEGVFVPEVWINVAKKTGIEELKLTTRDVSDYDVLMKHRIKILAEHKLTLKDIQNVIATIRPLDGANEFIGWIKKRMPMIIVSDTFEQFADPLMEQLGRPTLFCHSLEIDNNNMIVGYNLRQKDPKRRAVEALQGLNYNVLACGDSYNDTSMLLKADKGILYCPPENVIKDFPQLPVVTDYNMLKTLITDYIGK